MGGGPSQLEEVKSIHGKNDESESVQGRFRNCEGDVLLDSLKEVSEVVGL